MTDQTELAAIESKKLIDESNGQLKLPSDQEVQDFYNNKPIYVNKFMATAMKNSMVGIGLSVEYTEKETRFLNSFVCTINDLAGLHTLITKMLTTFQQQQAMMMQQLQGKVNPSFVEQVKAMQDAQKNDEAPVAKAS